MQVPDPADSPLHLVDKYFIEPIPGQEGVGESTQAMLVSYVMSAKRHCQMLVWGTGTIPKSASYWCSICKHALCIDPCVRLYQTEKDYTSEIIKIARMSVKPTQKDAQHVQKDAQNVQKDAQHV